MELATRGRVRFPCYYKGFYLTRSHGHLYGIPPFLDPEEIQYRRRLHTHPAVVSASTLEELEARIDSFDAAPYRAQVLDNCEGFDIVRHCGRLYAIRRGLRLVDLNLEEERRRAGVFEGTTCEEIRQHIRAARQAVSVEFAGWLPIYELSGNCGRHPQFVHTANPPAGYQ